MLMLEKAVIKVKEGDNIILAPHGDDEIIGCYTVLKQHNVHVVYLSELDFMVKPPWRTYRILWDELPHLLYFLSQYKVNLYAPDFNFEFHPVHKAVGGIAYYYALRSESRTSLFLYSTNMNAPYIKEVSDYDKKRQMLDEYYYQKRDLWLYDHRYFLFEGQVQYV